MRKLRVWGVTDMGKHGKQVRRIVATATKGEAVKALGRGWNRYNMDLYGAETGNEGEVRLATSRPGVVFSRPLDAWDAEYEAE